MYTYLTLTYFFLPCDLRVHRKKDSPVSRLAGAPPWLGPRSRTAGNSTSGVQTQYHGYHSDDGTSAAPYCCPSQPHANYASDASEPLSHRKARRFGSATCHRLRRCISWISWRRRSIQAPVDRGRIRPSLTSESGAVGASRSPSEACIRVLSVFGSYSVTEGRVEDFVA